MIHYLKKFLYNQGYKINKINKHNLLHEDYLVAITNKVGSNPVFFDIGANIGQTVSKFKSKFPSVVVHSFEPSKLCFKDLKKKHENTNNVVLNNKGVSFENGTLTFNEYSWSALNSFLKRSFTKSKIIDNYQVDLITVDDYCAENYITKINLLKTDTEGYELNVLKGAKRMMSENNIQFVYVEVFFLEHYIGQSSFGDIYNLLLENGFNLVRFYVYEYTDSGLASRTDALFINEKFVL